MISRIPPFALGFEYQQQDSKRWPFVLECDVHVVFDLPLKGTVSFRDSSGKEWARFIDSVLVIREGYAWDGPTSAPRLLCSMLASLVHDVLYQFLFTEHMRTRMSKEQADVALYDIMRLSGSRVWKGIFYAAVKMFGRAYLRDRNDVHSVLLAP